MILKAIMRYFSYVFHGLLALFSIAVSALALGTGAGALHLGMLPWSGDTLNYVLLFGALFGLLTVALAIKGTLRILFLIWSFLVFVLLVKGYIFSGYKFAPNEFRIALYLIFGALISLFGAWFQLSRPRTVTKKY
jgi:ABC-type maltose transport system permease subunit